MIGLMPTMNATLMAAFIARIGEGAYCHVFGSTRPAVTGGTPLSVPICAIVLPTPCGTLDVNTGAMLFATTDNEAANGQIINAVPPKWVRFFAANNDVLFDLDARLNGDVDAGQELVLTTSTLNVGAFMRIAGGSFTA